MAGRRSVPLLEAARDDVVACLAQVLDGRVSLGDLVHLGVACVVERGQLLRLVHLVGRRLNRGLLDLRLVESTSLQGGLLARRLPRLRDIESIVEVLRVEDPLGVLGQLFAQKDLLLVLVPCAHVACLVHVRSCTAVESPIVLVEVVLGLGVGPVEAGHIRLEIWVFSHPCFNTEFTATSDCARAWLLAVFERSNRLNVALGQLRHIVEGLVCLCKLSRVGRLASDLPMLDVPRM